MGEEQTGDLKQTHLLKSHGYLLRDGLQTSKVLLHMHMHNYVMQARKYAKSNNASELTKTIKNYLYFLLIGTDK